MKIQFVQQHIVRGETRAEDLVYEKDQVVDFGKDRVANTYAEAYIERGYAVEFDSLADRPAKAEPKPSDNGMTGGQAGSSGASSSAPGGNGNAPSGNAGRARSPT